MATLAENVQKVKDARDAIKTAIVAKGVEVPEGTKLSEMPTYVEKITGADEPDCVFEIVWNDGSKTTENIYGPVDGAWCFSQLQIGTGGDQILPSVITVKEASSAIWRSNATYMFSSCFASSIVLPTGFGRGITHAVGMFAYPGDNLTSLTIPEGALPSIINSSYMFQGDFKLTSLTLPQDEDFGSQITDASHMFESCSSLETLRLPGCSAPAFTSYGFGLSLEDAASMFSGCYALKRLVVPTSFGMAITDTTDMFTGCTNLTTIIGLNEDAESSDSSSEDSSAYDPSSDYVLPMRVSFDLSPTALDEASLIRILNSLRTVEGQTVTLGDVLKAKLTSERGVAALASAESKGWTIA